VKINLRIRASVFSVLNNHLFAQIAVRSRETCSPYFSTGVCFL